MVPNSNIDFFDKLKREPQKFYIVHYSCENLHDGNQGLSPRVCSIVVMHYLRQQTFSFSAHISAEELGVVREDMAEQFDSIEKNLLCAFNEFLKTRTDDYFIHWNMRNITYGFEHIEHRMKLKKIPKINSIKVDNRFNLSDILQDKYGKDYTKKESRMFSLMELNGGPPRNFMTGLQEVEAFRAGDFLKLHNSTSSKVLFFEDIVSLAVSGKLKTLSKKWGIIVDRLLESRVSKTIALVSAVFGTLGLTVMGGIQIFIPFLFKN